MKKLFTLLMIIGILFSCSNDDDDDDTRIIEMRINHHQDTAIGFYPLLALLVQEEDNIGTDNWETFYDGIIGFDYVPGKIYNLSVKVEKIENPPQDVSSVTYTLLDIISIQDVAVDTLFDIGLKSNETNFVTGTSPNYKILNQIVIDCDILCEELGTKLQDQDFVIGTFKRVSINELELVSVE